MATTASAGPLVNALAHRDFFTNATVRLFVFADRVEIISPGHLPDTLTPEQMRAGTSNRRNKVLAEHAAHILPYRGLGTGIPRALGAWPKIDLLDEREANQFRAVVWRPGVEQNTQPLPGKYRGSTPKVGTKSGPSRDQAGVKSGLSPEQHSMMTRMNATHDIATLMEWTGRKNRSKFRDVVLGPLLTLGLAEMTIPDKPRSSKQRYRITERGLALLADKNTKGLA